MNKRLILLLGGGLVAATTLSLSATAVLATSATTWTVRPGGPVTGVGTGKGSFRDISTGTTLSCTSSNTSATVKSGSGLSGTGIAAITAVTYSNCTGPLGLTFAVQTSASETNAAEQNAKSFNAATGVATETITHISGTISGPSCSATVNGTTSAGNNGMVTGHYSNSTGVLTISSSGGNLHIFNVSGCAGLINSGDSAAITTSYKITPHQTITSP
jgi:hypothetical protein